MDLPMAGCLFIIGKMLGVTPWDGSPFIIKPIYTPYIVGICWLGISPFKGLKEANSWSLFDAPKAKNITTQMVVKNGMVESVK